MYSTFLKFPLLCKILIPKSKLHDVFLVFFLLLKSKWTFSLTFFTFNEEFKPTKNGYEYCCCTPSILNKKNREKNIIDFRTYGVIHFLFANYLQSRFSFQLGLGWRGCPFILLGKEVGKMGTFKNDKLKHTVRYCLESDERKNSH